MLDILELIQLIDGLINVKCDVSLHNRDSQDKEPCLTIRASAQYKEKAYRLERTFTKSELILKNVSDDHLIKRFCDEFNYGCREFGA